MAKTLAAHERPGHDVSFDLGKEVRLLTVNMEKHKPSFVFKGLWSGSDIRVVQRHLAEAYRHYTRELRRERLAINQPETPSATKGE